MRSNIEGGRSYVGFIDRARKLALTHVPKDQFDKFNKLSGADIALQSGNDFVQVIMPLKALVDAGSWTMP